jgi:hypothetical protein
MISTGLIDGSTGSLRASAIERGLAGAFRAGGQRGSRRRAGPRADDREEALAVWEYLGRRLNLKAVAAVLAWVRSTRSAAAAAY